MNPITRYEVELRRFTECRFSKVPDLVPESEKGGGYGGYRKKNQKQVCLAGLLIGTRMRKMKNGSKIITGVLDDRTARVEVVLFEEGAVSYDDFNAAYSVRATSVYTMTQAREKFARGLQIKLDKNRVNGSWSDANMTQQLTEVLNTYRNGNCPVNIEYNSGKDISQFVLGQEWNVVPSDELLTRLDKVYGEEQIEIMY